MGAAWSLPVAKVIGTSANSIAFPPFGKSLFTLSARIPCAGSCGLAASSYPGSLTSANILDSESKISPLSSPLGPSPGS